MHLPVLGHHLETLLSPRSPRVSVGVWLYIACGVLMWHPRVGPWWCCESWSSWPSSRGPCSSSAFLRPVWSQVVILIILPSPSQWICRSGKNSCVFTGETNKKFQPVSVFSNEMMFLSGCHGWYGCWWVSFLIFHRNSYFEWVSPVLWRWTS